MQFILVNMHSKLVAIVKPTLEILAGIPSVVYGFLLSYILLANCRGLGDGVCKRLD